MSLKTVIVEIEDTALDALKSAGHVLEGFVVSEGQKLVAQVKQSNLGTTALNIISALESHTGSGTEKMAMLIAAVVPALQKLLAEGGLKGLLVSIVSFATEFCQSVYNDFKALAAKVAAGHQPAVAQVA